MIDVQSDKGATLRVNGEATIGHARELHAQLSEFLLEDQMPTALDLAQLTALDSAGAQVLIAFKRAVPALAIHSCPESIRQFAERTGLDALLF